MGIFIKQETRSYTNEEKDVLISMIPNFVGLGVNYTSAKAIENSDIWAAINNVAGDIASLDLNYYKSNVKQDYSDFSYLFNVRPNLYYSGYILKFIVVANILLNGESFVELIRDKQNNIIQIYHVKNSQIVIKQDATTNYDLVYEIQEGNKTRRVDSSNILHFKFFSTDGIRGISPLISLKEDLQTQNYSKKFLTNFFKNGLNAGGLLTVKGSKLSEEARENLRNNFQKTYAGTDESHKILLLDETMEFEQLEIDTEILKLINTSNFSTEQVAKVFKLPRSKMGLESPNENLEQSSENYIINGLNPYLTAMASEINFKVCECRETSYKFDVDAFKFIDIETKTKTIKERLTMGVIDLNEARKDFGYEEKDGEMFKEHYMNLNHVPLSMLKEYQVNKLKHAPISLKGGDIEDE